MPSLTTIYLNVDDNVPNCDMKSTSLLSIIKRYIEGPEDEPLHLCRNPSDLQLTDMIKEANSVSELESLCSGRLNVYHATAVVHRLAKMIGVQR